MASRILTVSLETKYYQASIPTRRITYKNDSIELTNEEYDEIISELPSFWNTDNDKLLRFILFDDHTYFCERQKNVFNYSTRESETKIYRFDHATEEEANALYVFFVEKYSKIKFNKIENLYDAIMDEIKDMSIVKISILDARDQLLNQTDYVMMPDYPISEEDKQIWAVYRQELRDLTDQEAWKNNDLMDIVMPVSPQPLDQISVLKNSIRDLSSIPDDLTVEMMSTVTEQSIESIIKNIAQISVKFELLNSISKMKLPVLNINYDDIIATKGDYETFLKEIEFDTIKESVLPENWWEAATSNIEEKIEKVNQMLRKYDVGFTINDILNAIIEDHKVNEQTMDEIANVIGEL